MTLETRLRKLEAGGGSDLIPVWCADEADKAETINAMISDGEIAERDRSRCVFWESFAGLSGGHELALEQIA